MPPPCLAGGGCDDRAMRRPRLPWIWTSIRRSRVRLPGMPLAEMVQRAVSGIGKHAAGSGISGEYMKEKIYEIKLTESTSIQIEQQQGIFMSKVFDLAKESGLIGHGIKITWLNVLDDDAGGE